MIELLLPKSSHLGEPLGTGCETNIATVKSMLRVVRRLSGDNEFLSAVALQDAVATQSVVRKGEVRELSARIGGSMQTPLLKPCVIVVGSLHHDIMGGAMVKRHWVKRYKELPPHDQP